MKQPADAVREQAVEVPVGQVGDPAVGCAPPNPATFGMS